MSFLSTPSARRATKNKRIGRPPVFISIHALREEGDERHACGLFQIVISIHALREEGDTASSPSKKRPMLFLSTPSARRATERLRVSPVKPKNFYPRPPRGGRRHSSRTPNSRQMISIHALREEGDFTRISAKVKSVRFLSTPSARRATPDHPDQASPEHHFYPRPPRGGRHATPLEIP